MIQIMIYVLAKIKQQFLWKRTTNATIRYQRVQERTHVYVCMCVPVCIYEREKEREDMSNGSTTFIVLINGPTILIPKKTLQNTVDKNIMPWNW